MKRAALLALALAFVLPAASAHAAPKMEMAVQDDPVFLTESYYDRERALQQARDLGISRIRANVNWATAVRGSEQKQPPRPPLYDWGRYDSLIDAAARYGIRIQLTLTGPAPAFAAANRKIGNFGPKAKHFGDFARAAATHFRGRVDRYSIWNEPNYVSWLEPHGIAPALYRELYQASYKQIKRADKRAQVLIGETAPYAIRKRSIAPLEFLRDVTCATGVKGGGGGSGVDAQADPEAEDAGVRKAARRSKPPKLRRGPCKPLQADGYAHHPYDYRNRPNFAYRGADNATLGSLDRLTGHLTSLARIRALATPKRKALPVYLTEYGYFQSGKYALGDSARSAFLKKAYTMAQRDRSVAQMLQFIFVTPPENFPGGYFDLSLVRQDGSTTLPYESLRAWAAANGKRGRVALPGAPVQLPSAPASRARGRSRASDRRTRPEFPQQPRGFLSEAR
jgi:hypothetical protein